MREIVGWTSAACFAFSALPMAYKAVRTGTSRGLALGTLLLWIVGEACALVYVLPDRLWPLISNYIVNLILLSVVAWYWFNPTKAVRR